MVKGTQFAPSLRPDGGVVTQRFRLGPPFAIHRRPYLSMKALYFWAFYGTLSITVRADLPTDTFMARLTAVAIKAAKGKGIAPFAYVNQ